MKTLPPFLKGGGAVRDRLVRISTEEGLGRGERPHPMRSNNRVATSNKKQKSVEDFLLSLSKYVFFVWMLLLLLSSMGEIFFLLNNQGVFVVKNWRPSPSSSARLLCKTEVVLLLDDLEVFVCPESSYE